MQAKCQFALTDDDEFKKLIKSSKDCISYAVWLSVTAPDMVINWTGKKRSLSVMWQALLIIAKNTFSLILTFDVWRHECFFTRFHGEVGPSIHQAWIWLDKVIKAIFYTLFIQWIDVYRWIWLNYTGISIITLSDWPTKNVPKAWWYQCRSLKKNLRVGYLKYVLYTVTD